MKKVLLLALPVLAAAALAVPTAFAGNASVNKANGDLWFTNNTGPAHWVFNAQDLGQTGDKGSVTYEDAYGIYTADVTNAVVESGKATFTVKITSSTIGYANVNDKFTYTVSDSGTGMAETSDYFTFNSMVLNSAETTFSPPLRFDVTAGNIQVHFNG